MKSALWVTRCAHSQLTFFRWVPPFQGGASLLQRVFNQTSITVSNMLGPIEPVSLAGNPITVIAPTAPPVPHVSSTSKGIAVGTDQQTVLMGT